MEGQIQTQTRRELSHSSKEGREGPDAGHFSATWVTTDDREQWTWHGTGDLGDRQSWVSIGA